MNPDDNITKRCKVVDQDDIEYRPVPDPAIPGKFILSPCNQGKTYIFPSHRAAFAATHHTYTWRKTNGMEINLGEFVIFDIGTGKTYER